MATVMIKEEIFSVAEKLALEMGEGWDSMRALGALAYLWNGSQSRGISEASTRQIKYWTRIKGDQEAFRLIELLCDELYGLLKKTGEDSYFIVGNPKHIDKLNHLQKQAKSGGKATRDKWRNLKSVQNQALDARPKGVPDGLPKGVASGRPEARHVLTSLRTYVPSFFTNKTSSEKPRTHSPPTETDPEILKLQERLEEIRRQQGIPADGQNQFEDAI